MTIQLIVSEISKAPSLVDNFRELYDRYSLIDINDLDNLDFGVIFSELDTLESLHDKLQNDNVSVSNIHRQFHLSKKYVDPNNSDSYFI